MGAYNEIWLGDNKNRMELTFMLLYEHKYNFFDSVREFMSKSPIRAGMDVGAGAYMFRLHKNIYASVDYSHLPVTDNSKLLHKFKAMWLGEVYSYFQWYYGLPSKEIVFKMPPEKVKSLFWWAGSHGMEGVVKYLYNDFYGEKA